MTCCRTIATEYRKMSSPTENLFTSFLSGTTYQQ